MVGNRGRHSGVRWGAGDREDMNVRKSGLHCGKHSEILLALDQKESACRIHLP